MKKENLNNLQVLGRISTHQWGVVAARGGATTNTDIGTMEISDNNGQTMEKTKTVRVIGGVQEIEWGTQYRQQHRVIDKFQSCYAINASAVRILVIRKCKKDVFR